MVEIRTNRISKKILIDIDGKDHISAILSGPHHGSRTKKTGIIIAHGAGNDMHNPLIVAVADGLAAAGTISLRFNFPYKEKGRKSPDSQAKLMHSWRRVYAYMFQDQHFPVKRIIAAGKSMGGRVASQVVAEDRMDVPALIFLGYPLHAPGKKDHLRDAHLYRIHAPMLFFAGTRDPLCDLEKLNNVLDNLQGPHDLEIIEGGNHSFKLPKSSSRSEDEVHRQMVEKCVEWVEPFG